ncbi:MAG: trypsin-like peptidase domain-containing protein [Bacteroidia bacterium]|nr:trypsin-like peptidase domain-containing protein [Bacteroidia bacterium]
MNTKRFLLLTTGIGFLSGVLGAFTFQQLKPTDATAFLQHNNPGVSPVSRVNYNHSSLEGTSFVKASQISTPCVVFIKTLSNARMQPQDPFFNWFGDFDFFGQRGPVSSSGSGVILSADGYIVTNFHVVKGADVIEVVLNNNKHNYKAKVIGTDPSTDLALLKIEAKNLPHIAVGNSDNVTVGDWVVAVGNPFNLTSTVTAGIVSAKGRNINIVNNQFPIESFIQTDAAINPGNSGGALVDLNGQLVGINTAIASNTGSYNGYGFAIPANIVTKIVKDLIEFGEVQRGFTGLNIRDIDGELSDKLHLEGDKGVYVEFAVEDAPGYNAGIKEGDVIIKVDNKDIDSKAIFDEQISYHRPGEKIPMVLLRSGKPMAVTVTLINRMDNDAIMKKGSVSSTVLGADFQFISKAEKEKLGVSSGIRISNVRGGRMRSMNLPEGFVITALNKKTYTNLDEFIRDMENVRGQILIEGVYPNGGRGVFSFYSY